MNLSNLATEMRYTKLFLTCSSSKMYNKTKLKKENDRSYLKMRFRLLSLVTILDEVYKRLEQFFISGMVHI